MRHFLALALLITAQTSWSQAGGDRIGSGTQERQLAQKLQRYGSVQIICNVNPRYTNILKHDATGTVLTRQKKVTVYDSDLTDGLVTRALLDQVVDRFTQVAGPTDVPYVRITGFSDLREVGLFEQQSGLIRYNANPAAQRVVEFINQNCQ